MTDPWTTDGTWLRSALHAHTTRSDGELAPRRLARHYERASYDVLAVTDHWRITDAASSERLLVIPSVELNCILPGARDGHVLAFWTGVTPGTLELPENVTGIEVFNAGCELEVGRGLSAVHWDELLEAGRLCPAIAADDSHSVTLVSGRTTGAAVNVGRLGYRHAGRELECDQEGLVVHARLDVPRSARHVRVEVTDAARRKAWANPIAV